MYEINDSTRRLNAYLKEVKYERCYRQKKKEKKKKTVTKKL